MQVARPEITETRLRIAEIVSLLARSGVVVLMLTGLWLFRRERERVERSHAVIETLKDVQRDVMTAHHSHAVFLLSGDSNALAEYDGALARSDSGIVSLELLTASDTLQAARRAGLTAALRSVRQLRTAARVLDAPATEPTPTMSRTPMRRPFADSLRGREALVDSLLDSRFVIEQQLLRERRGVEERIHAVVLAWLGVAVLITAVLGMGTLRVRHRYGDALARSAATFRRLAEDSPDGVLVHIDGTIVFANAAAACMLMTERSLLVGTDVFSHVHPDDRSTIEQRTVQVAQERQTTAPRLIRFLRSDGTACEAEARGAPIDFDLQPAVQVVLRDLTARRVAEHALQSSEQRFRAVLDAMGEGVVLQDTALAIQLWNPAAERILGLTNAQMTGRTSYDPGWRAIDQFGRELNPEQHIGAVALRTGKPADGVMGVERPARDRVWLQVTAVPLCQVEEAAPYAVVVTFSDITAQRLANERLRVSEIRYRLLAENSADLVILRAKDRTITYASPSHARVLGWDPEELIGQRENSLLHADDAARGRFARAEAVESDPQVMSVRLRHKQGHYVWVEIVVSVIRDANGDFDGYLVTGRDVTTRLALEDELHQAQKMEVMGRMASGVAHDFNNLLTVIRLSTEMLRLETRRAGVTFESLTDIESAVDRASALTAHLLTFSRRQHSAPSPLLPGRIAGESLPILKRLAGSTVSVTLDSGPEMLDAWIWGDQVRFEQVLVNLVSNAKDAMPDGGTVRVTCATVALQESVAHRFGVIAAGRYVTLTVEDTGIGMTSDVLAHLFDPFYTTKPQGRGTGLGLSIVYGVVHEALGTITVSSAHGSGSRITVYWPRSEAPAAQPRIEGDVADTDAHPTVMRPDAAAASAQPDVAQPAHAFLLVDDEESVRRVLARQLEANGHVVTTAASGIEALEILRSASGAIAGVISDVRMPGMTGVQLVEQMHAEGMEIPVLLISGQLDEQLPREWAAKAHVRFLPKPISGLALGRAVLELIEHSSSGRGTLR